MRIRSKFILYTILPLSILFGAFIIYLLKSKQADGLSKLDEKISRTNQYIKQVSTEPLWQVDFSEVIPNCVSFVEDPDIYSIEISGISKEMVQSEIEKYKKNPGTAEIFVYHYEGKDVLRFTDVSEVAEENRISSSFPIEYNDRNIADINIIYSDLPLQQEIGRLIKEILFLIAVSVLVLLLIFFLLTRSITKPIDTLLASLNIIDQGNLNHRVKLKTKGEFAVIEKEFNKMVSQLQKRELQLTKANDELEERVKIRTQELERINAELEGINSEMKVKTRALQESNDELEQFAYVASHDLKEPLRSIGSFVQLLKRKYSDKLDESAEEYIKFTVDGVKQLQKTIDDLLDFSRIGNSGNQFNEIKMETVIDLVKTNLDASITESGAIITVESPLPVIQVDRTQMVLLLQNLISNAIKFQSPEQTPNIKISYNNRFEEHEFIVEDNGIGINEDYKKKIFFLFQRLHKSKYAGSGIGLAMCKKIVERHGGAIWFDSIPNQGTKFHFTISKDIDEYDIKRKAIEQAHESGLN